MSLESSPKAKSRLSPSEASNKHLAPESKTIAFSSDGTTPTSNLRPVSRPASVLSSSGISVFFSSRLRFVLLLVLGIIGYGVCGYILTTIPPEQVANIWFYHSYLPLIACFFMATFFFGTFLFLHSRRAFFVASVSTILLFLRLQDVVITNSVVALLVLSAAAIELLLSFIFKK